MATGRWLGIMTLLLNINRWLRFYHIFPQAKSVEVWELSQEDVMKFIVFYIIIIQAQQAKPTLDNCKG